VKELTEGGEAEERDYNLQMVEKLLDI